jgi:hypothetical protein
MRGTSETELEHAVMYKQVENYSQTISCKPAIGSKHVNFAPGPSLLFSAHILPPCASTIAFEM